MSVISDISCSEGIYITFLVATFGGSLFSRFAYKRGVSLSLLSELYSIPKKICAKESFWRTFTVPQSLYSRVCLWAFKRKTKQVSYPLKI